MTATLRRPDVSAEGRTPRRAGTRRPTSSRRRAGRPARRLAHRGPAVPRGVRLGEGRFPRRLDVLHAVGLPHHLAAPGREPPERPDLAPPLLVGPGPPAAPGRARGPGPGHRVRVVRGHPHPDHRAPRRPAVGLRHRHQLAAGSLRPGLRRLPVDVVAGAARVVAGGGGAVLPLPPTARRASPRAGAAGPSAGSRCSPACSASPPPRRSCCRSRPTATPRSPTTPPTPGPPSCSPACSSPARSTTSRSGGGARTSSRRSAWPRRAGSSFFWVLGRPDLADALPRRDHRLHAGLGRR